MKKGKHKREKVKIIDRYLVLVLIAILLLDIAYAQIEDKELTVSGNVESKVQEGVFISEITYKSSVGADTTNSVVNYFLGTMMDSKVVLGSSSNSTITYEVTVYNNTDKEQLFIKTLTDDTDEILYSNTNIGYTVSLEDYVTTIAPKQSLTFTITFAYKGTDTSNNILESKLNFRFKEKPTVTLSNNGEEYTLENIYPDYTPQEYVFTVSNYTESETNIVPMSYYFETTIDKPLKAKIYDQNGNEVTGNISIDGDGETKTTETYTLKIIWDDSNTEEGIAYNNAQYADETFSCTVELIATPNGEDKDKYMSFAITDSFKVNIQSIPFNFNVNVSSQNLIISENEASSLTLTVANNTTTSHNTNYEVTIENNEKFSLGINDEAVSNNIISRTLEKGTNIVDSFDIQFMADTSSLDGLETLTLKVYSKSLYIQEESFDITIEFPSVNVTYEGNGGSDVPEVQKKYQGRDLILSDKVPTRAGYRFLGWATTSDATTATIQPGDTYSTDEELTLYAVWKWYVNEDFADSDLSPNLTFSTPTSTVNSVNYNWQVLEGRFRTNAASNGSSMLNSTKFYIDSTISFTPPQDATLSFSYGVESTSWMWVVATITLTGSDGSSVTILSHDGSSYSESTTTQALTGGVTYTINLEIGYPKWYESTWGYIDNIVIE